MNKYLISTILLFSLSTGNLFAWGAGHDYQLELVLELLPQEVRSFFPKEISDTMARKYSHYPDSFDPFKESEVGKEAIEYATAHDVTKRYDLHKSHGKGVAFVLLVRAFADKNPAHAALWASSLTHSIGDEAACNHDPLIHFLTYAFPIYNIKKSKGVGLDYSVIAKTDLGKTIIHELAKDFKASMISDNPTKILTYLYLSEVEGNSYMTKRGATIASSYKPDATEKDFENARKALAELGVYGAKRAADVILTAWLCAQNGMAKTLKFDKKAVKEAKKAEEDFIASRPLSDDSIFNGLLKGAEKSPAIGVLIEPSQKMNYGMLAFSSKYIAAAAMRCLMGNGLPWKPVDIRTLITGGTLKPNDTPVLIVCSGKARIPKKALLALKSYTESGGKLLWIGGKDKGLLGKLSSSVKAIDEQYLPVTRKYGINNEKYIKQSSIQFGGALAKVFGDKPYPFVNNPDTPAGWQKPYCPNQIEGVNPDIEILATLKVKDKSFPVAGALKDKDKTLHVSIPEYLVAPYVFTSEKGKQDISKALFDSLGSQLFISCLKLLAPEFEGSKEASQIQGENKN